MNPLLWIALVTVGIVLSLWFPRWRLKRALSRPLPADGLAIIENNIPVYRHMPAPLQQQLRRLVVQFLYQKKFVGCGGLEVTDEMRYTIAGQACLLLLNRDTRVYPELDTILVYPNEFVVTRNEVGPGGVVTPSANGLLGESWGDGRVVLAWDHVQRGANDWTDGQNVVLHEFAHQLDSESGAANGAPYLPSITSYRSWATVLSRDFDNLRHDAIYHQHSVMDHYGATNPAEFFAVATETFFEKPYQMAEHHAELYAEFLKFYQVDPRDWAEPPGEAEQMHSPFSTQPPYYAPHW